VPSGSRTNSRRQRCWAHLPRSGEKISPRNARSEGEASSRPAAFLNDWRTPAPSFGSASSSSAARSSSRLDGGGWTPLPLVSSITLLLPRSTVLTISVSVE
jgi:hypothetical protein